MPRIRSEQDASVFIEELHDPNVELDLTSDPWNLVVGRQASAVVGRDVIHPGRLAPDGGRKPVGSSIPAVDRPLVDAFGIPFSGRHGIRVGIVTEYARNVDTSCGYDDTGHGDGSFRFDTGGSNSFVNRAVGDLVQIDIPVANFGFFKIATKVSDDVVLLDRSAGADIGAGTGSMRTWEDRGIIVQAQSQDGSDFPTTNRIIKSPAEYALTGAWSADLEGAIIDLNGGQHFALQVVTTISDRETTYNTNDTLTMVGSGWSLEHEEATRAWIIHVAAQDRNGVWVTNGRKFWLLKDGTYTQYLDLGSDTFLGERWDAARIANGMILFVNDTYPARLVKLDTPASTLTSDDGTLAGLVTPKKPDDVETSGDDDGNADKSWVGVDLPFGNLTEADYQVKIRAINIDDSAESRFVNVYEDSDRDDVHITIANPNTGIDVGNEFRDSIAWPPPFHQRWTHLEIWRTLAGGVIFYLERQIALPKHRTELVSGSLAVMLNQDASAAGFTLELACHLSDAALIGQTQMTVTDLLAGRPPPRCRRVVSLSGVTVCAGSASGDAGNVTAHSRNFDATVFNYDDTGSAEGEHALTIANWFTNYTLNTDDELVITAPAANVGVYSIAAKGGAKPDDTILLSSSAGPDATLTIDAYIRRSHSIAWPTIDNDEDVWYSRTDKFAPESFLTRTLRLSRDGDVFREIVNVGQYAAVIMAQRVHLLYIGLNSDDEVDLLTDTVSQNGDGTPWDRSVVVVGMSVIWARPDGPRVMGVSNEVGEDGHRGRIGMLDPEGRMRQWFEDAYNNGDDIDAGMDTHNSAIRFRRTIDANTFQVAQLSLRTRKWTLLDDDSGLAYVNTRTAGVTTELDELLYSITPQGAAFEVNHYGQTHPYSDSTVQDTLDGTFDSTFAKIAKEGIFDATMLGDVVRFRSSTTSVDGLARVITSATADEIQFDTVDGLAEGDEFIIGANRFRIRFAAINGKFRSNVKVAEGVKVKALPGPRNEGGLWPDPPPGKFTLRLFRDYGQILETGAEEEREISVFDADDLAHDTEDRVSSVEGDGAALQLELEMTDARTDFRVQMIEVQVREEGHRVEDASAEA